MVPESWDSRNSKSQIDKSLWSKDNDGADAVDLTNFAAMASFLPRAWGHRYDAKRDWLDRTREEDREKAYHSAVSQNISLDYNAITARVSRRRGDERAFS